MRYILKLFVRLGLWVFCERVRVNQKDLLAPKGPVLIVSNHPNSFLDAIIIGAFYQRKICFLARGDIFENPIFSFLLRSIGMIPIFRAREGKEHLHRNENSFEESIDILTKGGIILIFIEGICLHTHEIQTFKKGASKILIKAQQKNCFPAIHVNSLGYSNYRGIGKKVNLHLESLKLNTPLITPKDAVDFNKQVRAIMEKTISLPKNNIYYKKHLFYFLHLPYYRIIEKFVEQKTRQTVFYDSVLFTALLFTYPIYLGAFMWILWALGTPGLLLLVIPFTLPIVLKTGYRER